MKAHRKCILLAALIPVTAWFCPLAFAQEETGALNGQITDHDGLLMAGVKVQALSAGTNLSYLADTTRILACYRRHHVVYSLMCGSRVNQCDWQELLDKLVILEHPTVPKSVADGLPNVRKKHFYSLTSRR